MPRWKKAAIAAGVLALLVLFQQAAAVAFLLWFRLDAQAARPWTLYEYWAAYGARPDVARAIAVAQAFALGAPLVLAIAAWLASRRRPLYGAARFATRQEIARAGFLGETGIIVGKLGARFLMYPGQQHVLVAAPTRSGKGQGIVIPNCLNWPDSLVVLDIKRENWEKTAGFRAAHGQRVFCFDPLSAEHRTHRWNPLSYVSVDRAHRVTDIQKIAHRLCPTPEGADPLWTGGARSLFLGTVLYLMETPGQPVTLGAVLRLLQHPLGVHEFFEQELRRRRGGAHALSAGCQQELDGFIQTSEKARDGIRKELATRLEIFANPAIDAATAGDDFDLRDLRRQRASIYLVVTPDKLELMAPVLALFFQQVIDANTDVLPEHDATLRHQVLLLPDEFAALGRALAISKGISYLAGYNVRLLPIIQNPAQLRALYGAEDAHTFMANCGATVVFATKRFADAKAISESLGDQTVKGRSRTRGKASRSSTESDQRRALLLPQEISDMDPARQIIVSDACRPILCDKIVVRHDRAFRDRFLAPPEVPRIVVEPAGLADDSPVEIDFEALCNAADEPPAPDPDMVEALADMIQADEDRRR